MLKKPLSADNIHLQAILRAAAGIEAISLVLYEVNGARSYSDGPPHWWNDRIEVGLCNAAEILASSIIYQADSLGAFEPATTNASQAIRRGQGP